MSTLIEQLKPPTEQTEPPTVEGVLKQIRNYDYSMTQTFDIVEAIDNLMVIQNEELLGHLKKLMTYSTRGY